MSADTERHLVNSWNAIAHTDPITDTEADLLVTQLANWSAAVDGDGTIVLTIKTENTQNHALWYSVALITGALPDLSIQSVEVMSTATYDEVYLTPIPTEVRS